MGSDVDWKTCEYCGEQFRGQQGLRIHQGAAHQQEVETTVRCNWCGSEIDVHQWETDENHYCTRECAKAWNVYLSRGERHPNYVDGSSRGNRFKLTALVVRTRDETCVKCGAESAGSDGRALHVHHIVPESDTENPHDPTNLLSVCTACHRELEQLDPETQLDACGIESYEALALTGETAQWFQEIRQEYWALEAAPEPWPGMFAAAQQVLDEREESKMGVTDD